MLRKKNTTLTIIQLNEEEFRKVGKHGDGWMSLLRSYFDDKGDSIYITTNSEFNDKSSENEELCKVFNRYLFMLRRQNVIGLQIVLEK